MKRLLLLVLSVGLYLPVHASTPDHPEITQGLEGALPIAVVPFAWRGDALHAAGTRGRWRGIGRPAAQRAFQAAADQPDAGAADTR